MPVTTVEAETQRVAESTPRMTLFASLAAVAGQLALSVLLVRQFQLESSAFYRVLLVVAAGFIPHALLPRKYRLRFFVLLSLIGMVAALGIADGLWLIGIGMIVMAACQLPIAMSARIAIVLVLGAGAALARVGLAPVPWSAAVWPIFGSMFMFRLALYLYALKHDDTLRSWERTVAYFFMLPNMAYPLFPVVDYTTFNRTHYDADEPKIYQRGMQWIARGLLHLLLYRFVYLHLTLPGSEIRDVGDLARSMIATFLLYLRVSGQFHLAVGILHLFGFHLPETHKLYYLASSFTDFWRRINIYWKDFMMKLVYYPSYFRLRRFGDRMALIVATATVFLSTWLLHSYQWFWLQGGFPLTLPDALFWGLLGVLVIVTTLREVKRGRKRQLRPSKSFNVERGLRTTLMFCTLTVLWSLWSTESIVDWLWQWSAITKGSIWDVTAIAGSLGLFFIIAGRHWDPGAEPAGPEPFYRSRALRTALLLLALLALGQPGVQNMAPPQIASVLGSIRTNQLNREDSQRQFLGYYERLDDNGQLADIGRTTVPAPPAGEEWVALLNTEAGRRREDFLVHDIAPGKRVRYKGATLTTNQWGMRDRDYTLAKDAGVKRIAILGHSITMGAGVNDDEVFDALLERELNSQGRPSQFRYEVLNFSVPAYSVVQQMALLEERVLEFAPDVIVISIPAPAHMRQHVMSQFTRHILTRGLEVPYPDLREMMAGQGITKWGGAGVSVPYAPLRALLGALGIDVVMPRIEAESRLDPIIDDVVAWSIRRAGEAARQIGAVPVLLGLDDVATTPPKSMPGSAAAAESGFVVIDLYDVFQGRDRASLRIAPWDEHPNATGHWLMANRLLQELQKNDAALKLGLSSTAADN